MKKNIVIISCIFVSLLIVMIFFSGAVFAKQCPEGSIKVGEQIEGDTVILDCKCLPGLALINNQCVEVPETKDILKEQVEFERGFNIWLSKKQKIVSLNYEKEKSWHAKLSISIKTLSPAPVKLNELHVGDVILVGRELNPLSFVIDRLTGKYGTSHALVFLGKTPGSMLFLDHTAFNPLKPEDGGGTHIMGETEFYEKYGKRTLYGARVLAPLDGRKLLTEALKTAEKDARPGGWRSFRPTTFLLVGTKEDNAACSVRARMTVFKATSPSRDEWEEEMRKLGIFDLSPNSFFDKKRVGKYFVTFPVEK